MQCLGIDYGAKRWGLSHGDELGVAMPLPASVESAPENRFDRLAREIETRRITDLVVGYPYNMDGTAGPKAREVDAFIADLEKRFRLPVHRVDERLTTHEVEARARASAKRRAQTPSARRAARATGETDSRAAALILQDFLDARLGLPLLPED